MEIFSTLAKVSKLEENGGIRLFWKSSTRAALWLRKEGAKVKLCGEGGTSFNFYYTNYENYIRFI